MRLQGSCSTLPLSRERWGLWGGIAVAVLLLFVCIFLIFKMDIFWLRGDQMRWLWLVEKMYLGQFELSDLWIDESNTRAPACYLFFVLNGYFFKLNLQLEQVAGAIGWAGAALAVLLGCRQFLRRTGECSWQEAAVMLVIPLLVVNGHLYMTVLTWSLITTRMIDMMLFILVFLALSNALRSGMTFWKAIGLILFLAFSSLFFGRGYGQAMLLAVLFTLAVHAVVQFRAMPLGRLLLSTVPLACAALLCIFLFNYGVHRVGVEPGSVFNLPSLLLFSATLLGRTLTFLFIQTNKNEISWPVVAVGVFILSAYGLATWLFFKNGLQRHGWFPLTLMAFSAASVLIVYIGRGAGLGGGWQGALFPRHLPECSIGFAGVLTILATVRPALRTYARALVLLCAVLILGQSLAVAGAIYRAPFHGAFAQRSAAAFFGPVESFADPEVVTVAGCHTQELCTKDRAIVDRYGLLEHARPSPAP